MLNYLSRMLLVLTIAACDQAGEGVPLSAFSDLFVQDTVVHLATSSSDPLGRPEDIAIWNGHLAISDALAKNVKVFAADGTLRMTIGRRGDGPGEFRYPTSLVVDDRGLLAVLDELSGAVSFFSSDGTFVEAFRFGGALTGGMASAFQGTRFLVGTWLVDEDRQFSSDHVAHVFDNAGHIEGSFGQRPVAQVRAETPFMGMELTVLDDSLAVWGTVGRRTIYMRSIDAGVDSGNATDSIQVEGLAPLDWSRAPTDDRRLFQWVTDYELLTGILAAPGIAVVRFQGGDVRRGEAWYRYGLISVAEKRVVRVTDRSPSLLHLVGEDAAFGISIDDDGEAWLTRYRLDRALFPAS